MNETNCEVGKEGWKGGERKKGRRGSQVHISGYATGIATNAGNYYKSTTTVQSAAVETAATPSTRRQSVYQRR